MEVPLSGVWAEPCTGCIRYRTVRSLAGSFVLKQAQGRWRGMLRCICRKIPSNAAMHCREEHVQVSLSSAACMRTVLPAAPTLAGMLSFKCTLADNAVAMHATSALLPVCLRIPGCLSAWEWTDLLAALTRSMTPDNAATCIVGCI